MRFTNSLAFRVLGTTLLLSTVLVATLASVLNQRLSDGIRESKIESALNESQSKLFQTENRFILAEIASVSDFRDAIDRVVTEFADTRGNERNPEVALLQANSTSKNFYLYERATNQIDKSSISPSLRAKVLATKELQYEYAGVKAFEILQTINKRIEKLLDKDHLIGHSYFILKDGEKPNEKLKNSFYKSILPLLQEYFFGDFGKIGLVLGQGFVNIKNWDDKVDSFAEFDHESSGDFESKDVYEIIDYREPTTFEVNKVKMDFEKAIKRLMKLNIA